VDSVAYFARSTAQGLPNRCPILDRCERRFRTLEIVSNRHGEELGDFGNPDSPLVKAIGESAYLVGGNNNFAVGGVCPEVALFEPTHFFVGLSGVATRRGQYDKLMTPQYQVSETGHFSECAEYVGYKEREVEAPPKPDKSSFVVQNYQFLVGTFLAAVGAIAAIAALF
jgi:hypothetical protein